jgi:hypothetical protein
LIAGDKTGDDRWYDKFVLVADRLFARALERTQEGRKALMPTHKFRELLEAMPVARQQKIEKRFRKSLARSTSYDQIPYTESVKAHWTETTVGEHGELVLDGVPFAPGQPVEVLVVSKTAGSTTAGGRSLRDSVLEFREPLEPVAGEDWDALQ